MSNRYSTSCHTFWRIHSFINGSTAPLLSPGLFFSFVIFFTESVGLLGRASSPSQDRYLHTGQDKHRITAHTKIRALSGIRNHDPSVRAGEEISCIRPRGHRNRPFWISWPIFVQTSVICILSSSSIVSKWRSIDIVLRKPPEEKKSMDVRSGEQCCVKTRSLGVSSCCNNPRGVCTPPDSKIVPIHSSRHMKCSHSLKTILR
jgi:hypothetical protein